MPTQKMHQLRAHTDPKPNLKAKLSIPSKVAQDLLHVVPQGIAALSDSMG
jgi:hypothetical protein